MRTMSRCVALSLIAVCLSVLGFAVPAESATAHRGSGAIFVFHGESIQAAVDSASPGDTIIVGRGTYHESVAIQKDHIRLIGHHARLVPPASPRPSVCLDPDSGTLDGICVIGDVTFTPAGPTVNRYVRDVSVSGFTVQGFSGVGIFVLGGKNTNISRNVARSNGGYGVFAVNSTRTTISYNHATDSGEAGIYVGDSPQADASVRGNVSSGNPYGIFVRDAEHGTIDHNRLSGNCIGALFLADAPGPAGAFTVTRNIVTHNDKACPPDDEDGTPPLSGIGFAIAGAHDVHIVANLILNNRPSGPSAFTGGVVLASVGPTAPKNNSVHRNVILRNSPDLFSDGTGSGNDLNHNVCVTSQPAGLC